MKIGKDTAMITKKYFSQKRRMMSNYVI